MGAFTVYATKAGILEGQEQTLEPISTIGNYKVEMDRTTGLLEASVNGGAWQPFAFGMGGGNLQATYSVGATAVIAETLAIGPLTLTNAAAQSAFVVTQGAAVVQPGILVNGGGAGGSVGVRVAGGTNAAGGIEMSDGQNLAVSAVNEGRLRYNTVTQDFEVSENGGAYVSIFGGGNLQAAYTFGATAVIAETLAIGPVTLTNAAAAAQTLLSLTQNAAVASAAITVTAAGGGDAPGLRLIGSGATTGGGLEMTNSTFGVSAANEGRLRYRSASQTFQVSLNGAAYVDIATGVAGVTLTGAYNFGGAGAGRLITAISGAVQMTSTAADNNNILELSKSPAGAQSGSALSIAMSATATGPALVFAAGGPAGTHIKGPTDQTLLVEPGAGRDLTMGLAGRVTTLLGTVVSLLGVVIVSSASQGMTFSGSNTQVRSGLSGIVYIQDQGGTSYGSFFPTGFAIGGSLDAGLARSAAGIVKVTNGSTVYGAILAGTNAASANTAYAARFESLATAGQVAGNGIINIESPVVATGQVVGIENDLTTGSTPGAVAWIGMRILIPATTRVNNTGEGAISINSDATDARAFDIDMGNTGAVSGMCVLYYGGAVVTAGTVVGYVVNLTGNATPGGIPVTGIRVQIPATTTVNAAGEAALAINSDATRARALDVDVANTTSGGAGFGICILRYGSGTVASGQLVGWRVELDLNVTPGAQTFNALSVVIPATTGSYSPTKAAIYVESKATASPGLTLYTRQESSGGLTAGGIFTIAYGTATTLATVMTGSSIDLSNGVTPGSNAILASYLTVAATTRANTAGEGALVIDSDATLARCLDLDVANTSGTINILRYGAAVTLATSATIGWDIDLTTNSTPGALAVTGMRIQIPATTRANTSGEAALYINSAATAARVCDISIKNTTGTPFIMRYGAATTPAPVVMMTLDLSTNVTSNANANIGLDIPIVAADEDTTAPIRMNGTRFFVGTGAPNNANGSNNDFYFRQDGGVATSIYQRVAGAWVARC